MDETNERKGDEMNATAKIMIEEATMARDALHREMTDLIARRGGKAPQGWLREKAEALGYYNTLLGRLGAIPTA
jgi:hypothetical protein